METVRDRYDLNLTVTHPAEGAEQWPCGTAQCCEFRKVRPLQLALAGKEAWMTGLKRVDAPTRRDAPIVAFDENWGMVKINPLATWTEHDVVGYAARPRHPRAPARLQGLPLHRLRADHPSGCRRRGPARRSLVRLRQGRVRAAPLT